MPREQRKAPAPEPQPVPPPGDSPEVVELKARLVAAEHALASAGLAPPLIRSGAVSTDEMQVGQPGEAHVPSTGDARVVHSPIPVVDGRRASPEKLAALAFMDELVEVELQTSEDKYAEPVVPVWNDGRIQCFPRGYRITCKRKFIEVLARSKPVSYGSQEYIDAEGNRAYRYPKRTGAKYPFIVHRDSPRGREWLRTIMAEGQ